MSWKLCQALKKEFVRLSDLGSLFQMWILFRRRRLLKTIEKSDSTPQTDSQKALEVDTTKIGGSSARGIVNSMVPNSNSEPNSSFFFL